MNLLLTITLLFALKFVIPFSSIHKYEVIIDYIELPEGKRDQVFDYGTVRVKKFNRTAYVVHGDFELLQPFTDDLKGSAAIFSLQGNEYRRVIERKGVNLCQSTLKYRFAFVKHLKATNLPENYTCPVPAKNYFIHNFGIQNEYLPFEPPKGEKFRGNFTFYGANDVEIGGFVVYFILNKLPFI